MLKARDGEAVGTWAHGESCVQCRAAGFRVLLHAVRYCAVALTTVCHFCPAVFAARKAKRWVPAVTLTVVLSSVLVVSEYFFTPSIQSSMRAKVPVTLAAASACTVVPTVPLFAGEQTVTPGDVGALQPVPPLVTVIDTDFVAVV